LDLYGAPVTDLQYLTLVLGGGEYVESARFERGFQPAMVTRKLYSDEAELETNLVTFLRNAAPLRHYKGAIEWRSEELPTGSNARIFVAVPRYVGVVQP
jgi:hypothetical protein